MSATRRTPATRTAKPAPELNLDDHEFEGPDGETYSIPSFGKFTAGDIRRVREMDEVSQMFTLVEQVTEDAPETLDAIDSMTLKRVGEFFTEWQAAAGVTVPN